MVPQYGAVRHRSFTRQALEIGVVMRRVWCVRAYEEGRFVVGDPVRELVDPGVQRIEETQAAHARPDAATVEDRQWSKAPAVGDNYDRHPSECECAARIAVHSRKLEGRFIKKALEAARLPEFPGARIGGVDVQIAALPTPRHSGGCDLRRHLLPVADVLGEIGAVAAKKHDHDRGTFGIEAWRNVQKHAVVTEGLRLKESMAAEIDVAPVVLSTSI